MIFQHNQIKKIIKALTLTFLLTCSAHAEAPQKKKDLTHEFMVGLESYKYHYGERTPKQSNFMQYNGMMFGVSGSYELTYKDRVFLRPEARVAYGFTQYTSYRNPKFPKSSVPNLTFEPRLLVGGNILLSNSFKLSPYVGLGYRYKSDDARDVVCDKGKPLGRKRISHYWYIPVGSRLTYDFTDHWFVKLMAEYDWVISGRQLSYSTNGIYPSPLVNKQKSGWGAKGELLVGHRFDKVSVAFGPYMNYWKIAKSKEVMSYKKDEWGGILTGPAWEPRNVTKEIGVKLNFYF